MHFATRVRTWRVARLYSVQYSETALSRKPFGIGHMYIYTSFFWLRMADTMASQTIDLSSWDTLYNLATDVIRKTRINTICSTATTGGGIGFNSFLRMSHCLHQSLQPEGVESSFTGPTAQMEPSPSCGGTAPLFLTSH
jgi:hypothetical protein